MPITLKLKLPGRGGDASAGAAAAGAHEGETFMVDSAASPEGASADNFASSQDFLSTADEADLRSTSSNGLNLTNDSLGDDAAAARLKVRVRLAEENSDDDDGTMEDRSHDLADSGPLPLSKALVLLLWKLIDLDRHNIFYDEVNDDIAPGYSLYIAKPMAFKNMQVKIRTGEYHTLDEFSDDLELVCSNCMTYNPDDSIFYDEAKRLRREGRKIISEIAPRVLMHDELIDAPGVAETGSDAGGAPALAALAAATARKATDAQLADMPTVAVSTIAGINIGRHPTTTLDRYEHASIQDTYLLYDSTAFQPLPATLPGIVEDTASIEDDPIHASSGFSVDPVSYARSLEAFVAGTDSSDPKIQELIRSLLALGTQGGDNEIGGNEQKLETQRESAKFLEIMQMASQPKYDGTGPVPISCDLFDEIMALDEEENLTNADGTTVAGLTSDEIVAIASLADRGLDVSFLAELDPRAGPLVRIAKRDNPLPPEVTQSLVIKMTEAQQLLDKNFQILCYLQMSQHSRSQNSSGSMAPREKQQTELLLANLKKLTAPIPPKLLLSDYATDPEILRQMSLQAQKHLQLAAVKVTRTLAAVEGQPQNGAARR